MKNLTGQSADYSHEEHDPVSSQILESEEEITQLQESHPKGEIERKLAYWTRQLDGTLAVLPLPIDRPRQAVQSFQAAHYTFRLPEALTKAVKALSQREDVTLFMTMLAAFQILLYRYTGQGDLLVGALDLEHAADASSCHDSVNTLPLRTCIDGHSPFQEVLRHIQNVVLEGQAHQDMALEQVLEVLQLERDLSNQPLYQVLFVLKAALEGVEEAQDPQSMKDAADYGAARAELALLVQETTRDIRGEIAYNSELFKPETIERMVDHWQKLLEGIVADSNRSIDALTLLTDAEWQEQVVEWNATETAFPHDQCFQQLFEAQVQRTPEAIAVVDDNEQCSYQQLNQRATHLAHTLQELGVGPEIIVALLAERSIAFLTAVLAVFKVGGAYLPLDPHHPPSRIGHVLGHSGARLVLVAKGLAPLLTEALGQLHTETGPQVIYLEDVPYPAHAPADNPPIRATPTNLAYVIYTSGSTGTPKGVMIEQRGMVNHLFAKINALQLSSTDRVAQTASQCFDISVWQFLAALLVGGRIHIFNDDISHTSMQLLEQVEQQQITILETVPSLLRIMLEGIEGDRNDYPRLKRLRWLIPTGEALPPEFCRRWLHFYPHVPLLNAYGPTECSDDVTHFPISQPLAQTQIHTPIGRAIQNMRLYVLNRKLQPLPVGVDGELYVGGVGVGRGYLNDVQRTAEAFVDDPFVNEPGMRLYKTGDLARYLPHGNIEFLGRIDHQVKIRGYRIELGEIEALLRQHLRVQDALVIVYEVSPGNTSLIAYVVTSNDVTGNDLSRYLNEKLPDYMVPAAFVQLESLPLTPNGKVDRRALPAPEFGMSEQAVNFVAPTLPVHQALIQIWEELLEARPIGIRDNFFELGGHSLLAIRLVDRIEQIWGKKISPATLLSGATIERLAVALMGEAKADTLPPLLEVQAGGSRRPFFYLHGQWEEELSYHCYPLARALGSDQPFYALRPYPLDGQQGLPTMEEIAAAHIEAIHSVQPEGPYLIGGWCNGGLVAYEMARQLQARGQVLDLLLLLDPPPLIIPFKWRWDRVAFDRLGRLLHASEQKRLAGYLRLKHLGRTLRYACLRREDPEHLAFSDLGQSYPRLFDWIATAYRPSTLYDGEVTFFWTEAITEAKTEIKGWRKVEAGGKIEVYVIPGDHMTSRQEYLPALAEQLDACVRKAQGTTPKREGAVTP